MAAKLFPAPLLPARCSTRNRALWAIIGFLALLGVLAAFAAYANDVSDLRRHVVLIRQTGGGGGSGVILHDGTVLKAKHVVVDNRAVTVITTYGGRTLVANQIWRSPDSDIAILRVSLGQGLEIDCRPPRFGEHISTIGFPMGLKWAASQGIVSMTEPDPDTGDYPIDMSVSPGSSGGPVLAGGKIIGMIVGVLVSNIGPSGIASMIPAMEICKEIGAVK